ncbi:UPF0496 protein, partial [Cucurbita argyrosperma subsp. sororia]
MKKSKLVSRLRKFLSDGGVHIRSRPIGVDVREEYANAFRTESYLDFWTRVVALKDVVVESTTASRLSSYRLFAEHLLDPTEPTVKRILNWAHLRPNFKSLLSDYFSHTANASLLCSRLLKDINHLRPEIAIQSLQNPEFNFKPLSIHNPFPAIIQNGCAKLLKQLEFNRDKARTKVKRVRYFQHSSAGLLVAVTASLTVILVTHGIGLVVVAAAPGLAGLVGAVKLARVKEVTRVLDVAAKATYTLNRDFDTVGRLVARLNQEVEHMKGLMRFWVERGEGRDGRHGGLGEVARQLQQCRLNLGQHLDELEEHLYLCFMTINRARNLVLKQILARA